MYLMYADEADHDGSKEFLVYASVVVEATQVKSICKGIQELRGKFGLKPNEELKFSSRSKPKHLSQSDHTALKEQVLNLAIKKECRAVCYVVPHKIAGGKPVETRLKFGVHTLLSSFDRFLGENGQKAGIAVFDFADEYKQAAYFSELQAGGVPRSDGRKSQLKNVVAIHQTHKIQSHLSSMADVVVGSFRFVMNEPTKDKVGTILYKSLAQIMWSDPRKKELYFENRGLCIRPKEIKSPKIQADVETLKIRLKKYLED